MPRKKKPEPVTRNIEGIKVRISWHAASKRWTARLSQAVDPKRTAVYGHTIDEVSHKYREKLQEKRQAPRTLSVSVTLGDYLRSWLSSTVRTAVVSGELAPKTAAGYDAHVRRHLIPGLGDVKLVDLRPSQVKGFMGELVASGLSPTTANRVRATLSAALGAAEDDGLVEANVIRKTKALPTEAAEPEAFTENELRRVMTVAREDRLFPLYALAMYTGMRSSELRGLRWQDVDLDEGSYRIAQGSHRITKAAAATVGQVGMVTSKPKTRLAGQRTALSLEAVEALRAWRDNQREENGYQPDHVFTTPTGRPLDASDVSRPFREVVERAGVRYEVPGRRNGRGLHALRATFTTLMLDAGVPQHHVQRLGRWARPTVMQQHYAARHEEQQRRHADQHGQIVSQLLRTSTDSDE